MSHTLTGNGRRVALAALTAVLFAQSSTHAQYFVLTERNLLTSRFDSVSVAEALPVVSEWKPYPTIDDRAAWSGVSDIVRSAHIAQAEALVGTDWPQLPATVFLEFVRTGKRSNYQALSFSRRERLAKLVLGEVMEDEGRFLDDIANGIWSISEETYWGVPAHLDIQSAGFGLPDVDEPTVDLFAAETAGLMAWTLYLLGDRLDLVSTLIRPRIRSELKRRVLDPNLERDDFWWMAFEPSVINNWTPWVNSNWLTVVLLAESDPDRRRAAVYKIMRSVDVFINSYPDDGGCDEGPVYWTRAGGSLFEVLEMLRSATDGLVDIYDEPLIRDMGRYILRGYVGNGYFINFADAPPKASIDPAIVFGFGERLEDQGMIHFGSYLAQASQLGEGAIPGRFGYLGRQLLTLFSLEAMAATDPAVPLLRDVWLPDTQVMTARAVAGTTDGLFLAAKAGHNEENHNHNDVGNFIIYADGEPLLIDLGPATYTAKTFSDDRFEIWNLQSGFHNVPTVNGVMQPFGSEFRAEEISYKADDDKASLSMDLTSAYTPGAQVREWNRRITLHRSPESISKIEITDDFALTGWDEPTTLNLMTADSVTIDRAGAIYLLTKSNPFTPRATITFDPDQLTAHLEVIKLQDTKLRNTWGNTVTRIVLTTRDGRLADTVTVSIEQSEG